MVVFIPAGCECFLPSRILALIIKLGLQWILGVFSPLDISLPIQL